MKHLLFKHAISPNNKTVLYSNKLKNSSTKHLDLGDDGFNLCDPRVIVGFFCQRQKKMICICNANHFHIDYNTSKFFPNAFLNSLPQSIA